MKKALNRYLNKYITLEEGEEFCPKCKGRGKNLMNNRRGPAISLKCHICHGEGKMDWVEKVVGKQRSMLDDTDTQQGPPQ